VLVIVGLRHHYFIATPSVQVADKVTVYFSTALARYVLSTQLMPRLVKSASLSPPNFM